MDDTDCIGQCMHDKECIAQWVDDTEAIGHSMHDKECVA